MTVEDVASRHFMILITYTVSTQSVQYHYLLREGC